MPVGFSGLHDGSVVAQVPQEGTHVVSRRPIPVVVDQDKTTKPKVIKRNNKEDLNPLFFGPPKCGN